MMFRKALAFLKDRRGSIAPIFAFSLVPTMGMIGAAVDYTRANSVRAAMQAALDSTTLAMAQSAPTMNEEALTSAASGFFKAQYHRTETSAVQLTTKYTNTNGSQLVMTASADVPTEFMSIPGLGINSIPVKAESTTTWGNTRLRVALALDNTGSMSSNSKMTALKTAAKGLIDQLKTAATKDGDVYVSVVPFAKDVNVGAGNKDAAWLDWNDWENTNGSCSNSYYKTRSNCVSAGKTWTAANHNTWTGCVTDRNQPYDTTNAAPSDANGGATRFPAEQYADCPVAMMPLSYDWAALKTRIDAMQPDGYTNTTIGLEWGWHSLTKGAPLNAPAEDSNYQYKKIIIFLTDGDNTQNRWTNTQSQIDARMSAACTNAKNEGIIVYTILVMQGSENLLKNCASSPSMYFKITQSNQLVTVFNQIGTQMSRLRVAK
jgi:Flp pilus assembly protein TadG